MSHVITCKICGKEAEKESWRVRYCSNSCKQKSYIKAKEAKKEFPTMNCAICKAPYVKKTKSKCCSEVCQKKFLAEYQAKWRLSHRTCKTCNKPISRNATYCRLHQSKAARKINIIPPSPHKCGQCPSKNPFGRCGALTSGPHQMTQAVAVRLLGLCPREHGVRDCLDVVEYDKKFRHKVAASRKRTTKTTEASK